MKSKLFLISLLFFTINSKAQSGEKFMKLQRVFSLDTSLLIQKPTSTQPLIIFKQTVPINKIWIVKNINFVSGGNTSFQNNDFATKDVDLSISVNNSPLIIQTSYGVTSNYVNQLVSVSNMYIYPTVFTSVPIVISAEKELRFYSKWLGYGIDSGKYRVHIYYSVEEYVVE